MRHVSLYRKWRPRTFDAVAGQEPVVRTLRRAVETGRVAHAYLFSGPRGTGKTSTAKVLAMGLNCAQGPTATPDGTCESCRSIVNNSSLDVLEMDAASNRGIDEIRDLRDKVNLAPAAARTKVYIIDEVHMLTTEAFNALLKMLEEPPEHVVFVLATTEKHKVPATIVSRCQSFDFRRPSVSLLTEKLREIADAEGIEAEPEALTILAREGRGSFRDAEGLLDQLASFAEGPVTAREVRELLGSVGADVLLQATDALAERRSADALRLLDRLSNEGKDLGQFAGELVSHLRRLMLLPDAPEVALAEVGAEERAGLEEQAGRVGVAESVRMISALGDAISRARRGGDAKLELELTFLKLARDYEEPSTDRLFERLEALERAVANGVVASSSANSVPVAPAESRGDNVETHPRESSTPASASEGSTEPEPDGRAPRAERTGESEESRSVSASGVAHKDEPGGDDSGLAVIVAQWEGIMRNLKERKQASAEAVFRAAQPASMAENVLRIEFPEEQSFYLSLAKQPKHVEELRKVLEDRLGVSPRLEFEVVGASDPAGATPGEGSPPPVARQPIEELPQESLKSEPDRGFGMEGTGPRPPESRSAAPLEAVDYTEKAQPERGASGGDGTIGSPREALEMAWDFFGGPGKGLGQDQNGGV